MAWEVCKRWPDGRLESVNVCLTKPGRSATATRLSDGAMGRWKVAIFEWKDGQRGRELTIRERQAYELRNYNVLRRSA